MTDAYSLVMDPAGPAGLAWLAAVLLGLRHATDPDHLTAVSTLVLQDRELGSGRAGWLGLAWGLGHAATLCVFGLPIVFAQRFLPASFQSLAEAAIGVLIVALAVRLLVRWRRGVFHSHVHVHGGALHSHPHAHASRAAAAAGGPVAHRHPHAEGLGRTPLGAFGVGSLHGIGGSAGVGILLVSATPDPWHGAVALLLFAVLAAVSMAALSLTFGFLVTRDAVTRRLDRLVPLLGAGSVCFGVWYAWQAMGTNS